MSDTKTPASGGTKGIRPTAIVAGVCAAAVVATGGALYATGVIGPKQEEESTGLKYETQGVVILEDDGSGIYDVLEPNSIALEFKNDAYSNDGKTFACYLGNSALNEYDMYVAVYADAELTNLLYLSGLVPPGSGFEEITLDQELPEGDHRVYIAFTQMEDPETIHAQTVYTMDFHVILD